MPFTESVAVLPTDLECLQTQFMATVEQCAILLLDPNGLILSWNRGAQLIKGWRADEVIGRHFSCLYPAADSDAGKPRTALQAAGAIGRFEDVGDRVRKDGSRFLAETVVTAIRGLSFRLEPMRTVRPMKAAPPRLVTHAAPD